MSCKSIILLLSLSANFAKENDNSNFLGQTKISHIWDKGRTINNHITYPVLGSENRIGLLFKFWICSHYTRYQIGLQDIMINQVQGEQQSELRVVLSRVWYGLKPFTFYRIDMSQIGNVKRSLHGKQHISVFEMYLEVILRQK